ncbi:hypothetical protein [Desulfosarcina alkanivorans]|uniref:hypothetical protein n=1 Tax=Desulfosarcina alkanivorans TaxID=571177 RepID=UPI0012D2ACD5|nr:hypothetical protein [Desulfosarcina alkanivorans]
MIPRHHWTNGWIGVLLLAAVFTGCTTGPAAAPPEPGTLDGHRILADLTPDIETLYLAWHELDQAYKDIKYLERAFLFDPDDRQLGTIQKAALYIQDASVRIHHQWEQLSVLHYVRPEMMRDYLTLRVKGLTSAIDEIGYDGMFLTIYRPHVKHQTVTSALDSARDIIEKNKRLLNQIRETLLPVAGPLEHNANARERNRSRMAAS